MPDQYYVLALLLAVSAIAIASSLVAIGVLLLHSWRIAVLTRKMHRLTNAHDITVYHLDTLTKAYNQLNRTFIDHRAELDHSNGR